MRKRVRFLDGISLIIWSILIILLIFTDYVRGYFAEWIVFCLLSIFLLKLIILLYDNIKSIYPSYKKKIPRYMKKIYSLLYDTDAIPVRLIWHGYLTILLFFSYTIILSMMSRVDGVSYSDEIVWSGAVLIVILFIIVYCAVYMDMFITRFKCINKYNVRYCIFMSYNLTRKWPTSTVLGKCHMVESCKHRGKNYATVILKKTGEVYEEVLVVSESMGKNVYELHEICHVRYII